MVGCHRGGADLPVLPLTIGQAAIFRLPCGPVIDTATWYHHLGIAGAADALILAEHPESVTNLDQHPILAKLVVEALIAAFGADPAVPRQGALEDVELAVDLLAGGADAVPRHLQGETGDTPGSGAKVASASREGGLAYYQSLRLKYSRRKLLVLGWYQGNIKSPSSAEGPFQFLNPYQFKGLLCLASLPYSLHNSEISISPARLRAHRARVMPSCMKRS